jgi:cobalamin biosynthesis Co2+ chelatase CbiK
MVSNISFLKHTHYCIVCKKQLDSKKLEREILNAIRYEHMPPAREDDVIILEDHGNDVSAVCSRNCLAAYFFGKEEVDGGLI